MIIDYYYGVLKIVLVSNITIVDMKKIRLDFLK